MMLSTKATIVKKSVIIQQASSTLRYTCRQQRRNVIIPAPAAISSLITKKKDNNIIIPSSHNNIRCLSTRPLKNDNNTINDSNIAKAMATVNAQRQKADQQQKQKQQQQQQEKSSSLPSSSSSVLDYAAKSLLSSPSSPSELQYAGNTVMPITTKLKIYKNEIPNNGNGGVWPVFRLMDENGQFRNPINDGYHHHDDEKEETKKVGEHHHHHHHHEDLDYTDKNQDINNLRLYLENTYPYIFQNNKITLLNESKYNYVDTNNKNTLMRSYKQIIRLRQMDKLLQNIQRQGRISFYMTCLGEEAIHIGTASALPSNNIDTIFAQYREAGILMWRGFTIKQFINQCFSNINDLGRGRQMPVHYGCKALNYHTISSPLGTQLPQAVGAAYKLKILNNNTVKEDDMEKKAVSVCYFGDGCASTTDFHSALNFAATTKSPVIFVCRNNGYAISTSIEEQYAGDGIVSRSYGYGMGGLRVDGNDIFAINAAFNAAREYVLQDGGQPILIELITYRQGHHSTSDDSTRYRNSKEVQDVSVKSDPLKRLKNFLLNIGWVDNNIHASIKDKEKLDIIAAMQEAEALPKPDIKYLFEDVYDEIPNHILKQQDELKEHLSKYPNKY